MKERLECPSCKSTNVEEISRTPTKIGRMTDYRILIHCLDCGKVVAIGEPKPEPGIL